MNFRTKVCTVTTGLLLLVTASACSTLEKLKARDHLNKGVHAYTSKQYEQAIEHFQEAVQRDPELVDAYLYLATAHRAQFIPQGTSLENMQRARKAIDAFQEVLKRASDENRNAQATAMASMAVIYSGMGEYDQAKDWYRKRIDLEPNNPEPYYGIATINWQLAYDETGMNGENVESLEEEQKTQINGLVDEGIEVLKKALELNPEYVDAMQYLNLLYREKAKLAEEEEAKSEWQGEADRLALRALEFKRKQQEEQEKARKTLMGTTKEE